MPTELEELIKKPIVATGTVELVAAKNENGEENGNKRMHIVAYNGGLMNVAWGKPVGIELSGLKWREDNAIPILSQHNTYSLDAICGQATKISHDGKSLLFPIPRRRFTSWRNLALSSRLPSASLLLKFLSSPPEKKASSTAKKSKALATSFAQAFLMKFPSSHWEPMGQPRRRYPPPPNKERRA